MTVRFVLIRMKIFHKWDNSITSSFVSKKGSLQRERQRKISPFSLFQFRLGLQNRFKYLVMVNQNEFLKSVNKIFFLINSFLFLVSIGMTKQTQNIGL